MNWEEKVALHNQRMNEWHDQGHKYFDLRFAYKNLFYDQAAKHKLEDPSCEHEIKECGGCPVFSPHNEIFVNFTAHNKKLLEITESYIGYINEIMVHADKINEYQLEEIKTFLKHLEYLYSLCGGEEKKTIWQTIKDLFRR
jgi:hypothetical protein